MQELGGPGGKTIPGARGFIPLIRPSVGEEELEEVRSVLRSGWLSQGAKVRQFEREFATHIGAKYAVATSSCTTALSLAIDALQLKIGSEMVVPDFTFPATANVVIRAVSTPVLVDVREDTFAIRPSETAKALGKKTSAIMPVHPFGHPFETDELYELASRKGIEVIEDAATAIGTKYKGKLVGASRRAVCFSFHPRKLLTTAEGGCLVTDDKAVYERAVALRNHGQVADKRGRIKFRYNGLNYRMSDVHAAIGIAQLKKTDSIISSRRRQAELYNEILGSSKLDIQLPLEEEWAYHTYQSYVIVLGKSLPTNDRIIRVLKERFRIETQVGTYSLSLQPSFRGTLSVGTLRTSRLLYRRSLTLPLFESLSEEDQVYIVESLASASRL
ncbi:MAG: DegT/DnrJ/EryC1/StrS aminotransferase family protein [Thaumarchaeota archaeon]|nr:MAG: DegT/DnrJ/EryC1/StrS aminotransferase family protein [Nitrososphaerota archaeon]